MNVMARLPCLLLVLPLLAHAVPADTHTNLHRLVRSGEVSGGSLATLHALHTSTSHGPGLSRRDLDPAPPTERLALRLASGHELRMSLRRRAVDTSGLTVTEVDEDGVATPVAVRDDCFYAGDLEGETGKANIAMCNGEVVGSVMTANRTYDVYPLYSELHKRSHDDVMPLVVTWTDDDVTALKRQVLGLDIPAGFDDDGVEVDADVPMGLGNDALEVPADIATKLDDLSLERRGIKDRKVTVELGDFLDEHYVDMLKAKNGMTSDKSITSLMLNKWAAAADVLSDKQNVANAGWEIKLRLVKLEIWRKNPSWYNTKSSDTLMVRIRKVCTQNKKQPYDSIMLHTGDPITANGKIGLAFIGGLCKKGWRCAASRSANTNFMTELHELGHTLGLNHDNKMKDCKNSSTKGFMGSERDTLPKCYGPVLTKNFENAKKSCVFTQGFADSDDLLAQWLDGTIPGHSMDTTAQIIKLFRHGSKNRPGSKNRHGSKIRPGNKNHHRGRKNVPESASRDQIQ